MPCLRGACVVLAIALWPLAGPAAAQVVRLPPVLPAEEGYPGRLVAHPDSSAELLQAPGKVDIATLQPAEPPGTRPGVFQKLIFAGTWLAPAPDDGFGISDLDLRMVLGFPCPTRSSPLLITPGFAVHYLDGPTAAELPPRLYDAYTQFRWMHRFSPRWAVDLAVTPGIYSDFQQGTDDGLRISGHGVAVWTCRPNLKLLLGAAYLDREDIGVLPAGGLIWTPDDGLKFELIVPRPRIAARVSRAGDVEDWVYLAGELGGGTWAVRRTSAVDDLVYLTDQLGGGTMVAQLTSGVNDLVTYRDWRVVLGIERKALHALDARLEMAYVFGRRLEFDSPTPDITPRDTIMFRGGVTY